MATKEEKKHLALVSSLGCLICQRPAICHHIRNLGKGKGNVGIGKRANHFQTIPICPEHHVGSFSIHNTKRQFEEWFKGDADRFWILAPRVESQGVIDADSDFSSSATSAAQRTLAASAQPAEQQSLRKSFP